MDETTEGPADSGPCSGEKQENNGDDKQVTLSKTQLKKMKRKEKWEQNKAEKRYVYPLSRTVKGHDLTHIFFKTFPTIFWIIIS